MNKITNLNHTGEKNVTLRFMIIMNIKCCNSCGRVFVIGRIKMDD